MSGTLKNWIAPSRTALLLIDMQADFAGSPGDPKMAAAWAAISQASILAEKARKAGVPCIFVRLITQAADETVFLQEWKERRGDEGAPLCRQGTQGAAFVGPQPQGGELVFSKKRYDAFQGTGLDAALRGAGVDTLVVAGLTTECCIGSSVQAAFERDYHVFVVRDATACNEAALHEAALTALELNCANLVSSREVLDSWN